MRKSLINTTIKPFIAKAFHQDKEVIITDADLKGKWSVIFFYPADFAFVCPTELIDLAFHYPDFQSMGVAVYAVSTDTHFTHKAWHDASAALRKIQFPMLGDPTGVICRNFGVLNEEEGVALRGTFVVNPAGEIKSCDVRDLNID